MRAFERGAAHDHTANIGLKWGSSQVFHVMEDSTIVPVAISFSAAEIQPETGFSPVSNCTCITYLRTVEDGGTRTTYSRLVPDFRSQQKAFFASSYLKDGQYCTVRIAHTEHCSAPGWLAYIQHTHTIRFEMACMCMHILILPTFVRRKVERYR